MMIEVMPASCSWRSRSEQVRGVLVVQARGRLVQDEQPDVLGQRLGDLDQLLLPDAELADGGDRVLVEAHRAEQPTGLGVGAVPVDEPAPAAPLVAQEDVLGDRQVRHQRELLVDDRDPGALAVPDVGERHRPAVEADLAVVGARRVHPGQHLHERGLAGAVLAADRVDLAAAHRERHVLQRLHAGEGHGDAAHLQDRVGCAVGLVVRVVSDRGEGRPGGVPPGRSSSDRGQPAACPS
jgi:hypothetical protein